MAASRTPPDPRGLERHVGRRGEFQAQEQEHAPSGRLAHRRRRAPTTGLALYKKKTARLIRGEDGFIAEIIRELGVLARFSHAQA
jgi:hypothetical protein